MNFDESFNKLLGHEGGYSNHAADRGGATMWGVTEAVARANGYAGDMKDFPQAHAKSIYRASYWDAVMADALPMDLRFSVFDAAVNSGVSQAVKWLQRATGAAVDGVMGPATVQRANSFPGVFVAKVFNGHRLQFMSALPNWPAFGRGWANRIAQNLIES